MNPIEKRILEVLKRNRCPDEELAGKLSTEIRFMILDAQQEETTVALPVLKAGDGWSYQITEEDILWLARAAAGEGGTSPVDPIWTWMQRYAGGARDANFRNYSSLTALVRAHSQPVNPIWQRDGSKCRVGGQYHGTSHCSEDKLRRREQTATRSLDAMPAAVKTAIVQLRAGTLTNTVPRAVDFADASVAASFVSRNPGAEIVWRRGNHFIVTAGSRGWPADWVTLQASSTSALVPWVLIGDSQAVGMKPFLETGMSARGYKLVGSFANVGWGTRQTLSDLGAAIRANAAREHPRLALVILGGNDTAGAPLSTAITGLLTLLRESGVQAVVWVGPAHATPADIAERKRRVAAMQKPLVEAFEGGAWLDGHEMTKTLPHAADGVHFLRSGQQAWAAAIAAQLALPTRGLDVLWALTPFGLLLSDLT